VLWEVGRITSCKLEHRMRDSPLPAQVFSNWLERDMPHCPSPGFSSPLQLRLKIRCLDYDESLPTSEQR
jgi:hypothetical protein